MQTAALLCCPSQTELVPCSVCPEGVSKDKKDAILPSDTWAWWDEGTRCDAFLATAGATEADTPCCDAMQNAAMLCCPSQMKIPIDRYHFDPCPFCPDGITAEDGSGGLGIFPFMGDMTCDDLWLAAKAWDDADNLCYQAMGAEADCCPR
jgi:hypothetical protein